MSTPEVIEAIVGPDGALVVSAEELERVGAHAGDRGRTRRAGSATAPAPSIERI